MTCQAMRRHAPSLSRGRRFSFDDVDVLVNKEKEEEQTKAQKWGEAAWPDEYGAISAAGRLVVATTRATSAMR